MFRNKPSRMVTLTINKGNSSMKLANFYWGMGEKCTSCKIKTCLDSVKAFLKLRRKWVYIKMQRLKKCRDFKCSVWWLFREKSSHGHLFVDLKTSMHKVKKNCPYNNWLLLHNHFSDDVP